jgi:hypothetical protein
MKNIRVKEEKRMDKLSRQYAQTVIFRSAIDREELFIRKSQHYHGELKDKELKDMVKEFEKAAMEHIKLLKDKMIKLNININS